MGFTKEGRFPEGRAGTAVVRGTNLQAVMQNPGTARCRGFCFWTTAVPDAGWSHTINHKSGMDHTTYAHTGAMVNLYAKGVGAENFRGVFDNTEIYHKLAELTGVQ